MHATIRTSLTLFVLACGVLAVRAPAARQSSDELPEPQAWVHALVHHRARADFLGGSFVRAEAAPAIGVKLTPQAQPSGAEDDGSAVYESPIVDASTPFQELLASWNIDVPSRAGVWIEVRVGRKRDDFWSPWLRIGEWGGNLPQWEPTTRFEGGEIAIDYFRSAESWDRAQYRVQAFKGEADDPVVRVTRFDLCLTSRNAVPPPRTPKEKRIDPTTYTLRLKVPFRSQKSESEKIADRICCPTSVAMVMAYRGVDRPTAEVAARAFDKPHDVYGNWPRAVQAAYGFGVPGYVARFSDWDEVRRMIGSGQPLIVSIASEEGQLTGAPYKKTDGHLLVIAGFNQKGDVEVNDPAAADGAKGQRIYKRAELEEVWLKRGGTALVLLPKN